MDYYYRPFPPANPSILQKAAQKEMTLLEDVKTLLEKIAASNQFSADIMNAAQESNSQKVERLIRSSGVRNMPGVSYTPDGIRLNFSDELNGKECCQLNIKLRWR